MDIPDIEPEKDEPALPPKISLKLLTDEKEMLTKAIEKWIKFNQGIWVQVNDKLENEVRRSGRLSMWLRMRDDLRYQWFNQVEVPEYATDIPKRLEAARILLREGPEKYNEILDKYAMKAEKGDVPGAQSTGKG